MTLRRWTVPLSAAAVVAGVILLAVWLAGGSSTTDVRSSAPPRLLHLASSGNEMTAMAASSTAADGSSVGGSEPYKLTGTLPAGTPDDQPLWRLRPATAQDAQHVADALQLSGSPTPVKGGWALRAGDNRLVVRDDGSWSYGMDCSPGTPVSAEDVTVGCAASSAVASSPDPLPVPTYPPGPSDAQARSVAGPIFDRLGLDNQSIVVYSGDPTATVQASPSVGGSRSVSWVTSVQVDGSGLVASADGWLGDPARGADYPVISAQRGFELLQAQPRPAIMLCAQRSDGKPGCADVPPTEVTEAALGVTLDQDGNKAVLVPAWLFTIKGQDEPVAQVAIDPSYLAQPSPPAPGPASASASAGTKE
jgi:hypothetical protein